MANSTNSAPYFPGMPQLTGVSFPRVQGNNLAVGTTNLYTVPTGKKAMLCGSNAWNGTGTNITWNTKINTTTKLINTTTNANTQTAALNEGYIASAGTLIGVECNNAGLNVTYKIIEFDASVPLFSSVLFTLSSGDSTIYTVPTGKQALLINNPLDGVGSGMATLCTYTFAAQSFKWYIVPLGQSAGTQYQITEALAFGSGSRGNTTFAPVTLLAGDSIVINSTTGNYLAWVNIYEF